MTAGPAVPLPVVESGPEALFRLAPMAFDGHTVSSSMPVGPWLHGADGEVSAGALGVLVDNVLGYAIIAARPPDHWSVSTEITLDVLEPLPADGVVAAQAHVVQVDRIGGFATGRVTDADGRLLALCTQRGRFVPAPGVGLDPMPYTPVPGSDDVVPWLRTAFPPGVEREMPEALANPMGNLHGGMTICLAALAAATAAPDHLTVASVHAVYARGVPSGSAITLRPDVRHQGRGLATVAVTAEVGGRPATISQVVLQPRDRT